MSWSEDENSEGELENESAKHVSALTGRCSSDTESSDDNLKYEVLASSYRNLFD